MGVSLEGGLGKQGVRAAWRAVPGACGPEAALRQSGAQQRA